MEDKDLTALKDYFKKLQRVITYDANFTLMRSKIIKKIKIDDILCCVYASIPDVYKKYIKTKEGKELFSAVQLDMINKLVKHKFFLNADYYSVDVDRVSKAISSFVNYIDRDVAYAEKNFAK